MIEINTNSVLYFCPYFLFSFFSYAWY